MRNLIKKFPIQSPAVRQQFVRQGHGCPQCGASLHMWPVPSAAGRCFACNQDLVTLMMGAERAKYMRETEDA